MIIDIVKVFIPSTLSFFVGIVLSFVLSHYLYKYKMWKKKAGKVSLDGGETPLFNELHKEKEVGTPKMGGVVIWLSVFITTIGIWLISQALPTDFTSKLDFLSRNQTWIPLLTLILGAFVGLIDDLYEIRGGGDHIAGGLSLRKRLVIVAFIAFLCAVWFYFKLDIASVGWFGGSELFLGWLFIPFFILVTLALYSGGVIDGLDGLAGGIFATMFSAYAGIAFYQQQINLAAFCAVVVGGILAFLWFNIPPARFYMSETGSMALTITLSVIAFMTDRLGDGHGILVLPIIAFPLIATSLSVIMQLLSKKLRNGKKVFLVAPVHHHFEAKGWPSHKVTMRYWVISVVFAIVGMTIGLIG
jgi:phospho-N-acetylmuramoyl-pentapeptide-transferase